MMPVRNKFIPIQECNDGLLRKLWVVVAEWTQKIDEK